MPRPNPPTPYQEVNRLLAALTDGLQAQFGQKLIGIYCYGSLIWGDFDPSLSDIDLAAILSTPVTTEELEKLRGFHARLAQAFPAWEDRIEAQYVSRQSLACFRTQETTMANISPGEPLHFVPCNADWLTNWYFVLTYGRALAGPPAAEVVPHIADEEFFNAIRTDAAAWREYVQNTRRSRAYQGYAILTLCRAYTTLATGKQVSKREAAAYVAEQMPGKRPLIEQALAWRQARDGMPDETTYDKARRFVLEMADVIEAQFPPVRNVP
ncbi:MAG: hypothetical protein DBY25_04305 [Clostridiales bacterium]|nr:MAG: hypothetical protein DBY25_04305 [Clostridiales bacterium]